MNLWFGRKKKREKPALDYGGGFSLDELDGGGADKAHTAQTESTVFSTPNSLHINNQQSVAASADPQGFFMQENQPSQFLRIKLVKPESFGSVTEAAQYLLDRQAVILNIENLDREASRRYIDFLSGVLFSIGGEVTKLTSGTYIFTSDKVNVSSYQIKNDPSDDTDEFM